MLIEPEEIVLEVTSWDKFVEAFEYSSASTVKNKAGKTLATNRVTIEIKEKTKNFQQI